MSMILKYLIIPECKKEQGFTLIELIVTVIMIGILTAVVTPGLVGSWRQSKVKESLSQLKSTLEQAQANANRMSTDCTVTINGLADGTSPVTINGVLSYQIVGSPNGCVLETINIRQDFLTITSSATTTANKGKVVFSFDGSPDRLETFVIYRNNSVNTGKCLIISNFLGMVRVGEYEGDASVIPPVSTKCKNIENSKYIKN